MQFEDIVVERVENWIEVTLNRPQKLNSLRERTAEEVLHQLGEVESDRSVCSVIIKGSEKAFCTGIDTSEFELKDGEHFDFYRSRRRSRWTGRLFRDLPHYTKPVLAVVEGFALGGGLELSLVCDIIVAGENASFGLPEARLGLMPGGGGTQTLPRVLGKALAKELIWTGRRLNAEEAYRLRLVNHVCAHGGALDKARELARTIGANAPLPVMLTKAAIDRAADVSLQEGMASEGDSSFLLYFSRDRVEGLTAFKEKRSPLFRGE